MTNDEAIKMALPVVQGGHECFAKDYGQRGVQCQGGYDARRTAPDGSHVFPKCPYHDTCKAWTASALPALPAAPTEGPKPEVAVPVQPEPMRPSMQLPNGLRINLPSGYQAQQPAAVQQPTPQPAPQPPPPQPVVSSPYQQPQRYGASNYQPIPPSYQGGLAVRPPVPPMVPQPPAQQQYLQVPAVAANFQVQSFLACPEPIAPDSTALHKTRQIGISAIRGGAQGFFMTLAELISKIPFTNG